MTIITITLLLVAALAVVLYPVLFGRSDQAEAEDPAEELAQSLRRARDRVYEEIRVLQQEHFLHHLTQEEYQERLQAARVQAALLLREQQRVRETVAELDQAVEEELRQAMQQRTSGPDSKSSAG